MNRRLDERSYEVETPSGTYRRNRIHIRRTKEDPPDLRMDTREKIGVPASAEEHRPTQERADSKPHTGEKPYVTASTPDPIPNIVQVPAESSREASTPISMISLRRSTRITKPPSKMRDYVKK